jgi:hypothetical protein
MATYARAQAFFPIMTLIVVVFVFTGFGAGFATGFGLAGFPPPPALVLHGAVTLTWFALTLVQALLIRRANFTLHKTLGWASMALALAIVVLGYLTVSHAIRNPAWSIAGFDNVGSAVFPFFDIVTFMIVYALGIANRKNAPAHKRLMVLAGVMMMDPAVARTAIILLGAPPAALLIELAVLLAFPIYDWRTRGKPHWASLFGLALFMTCFALRMALGGSDAWAGFAQAFF